MDSILLKPEHNLPPKSAIILLHGYGADASDLKDIGLHWQKSLPETLIILPNGIKPCEQNPYGRQWFSLLEWTPQAISQEAQIAAESVIPELQKILTDHNLTFSDTVLSGFSQGAMMSFEIGFQSALSPLGILSYSGGYVSNRPLTNLKPIPVTLIHGDQDQVLEIDYFHQTKELLENSGVPVNGYIRKGMGHSIDEFGIQVGLDFIQKRILQERI